MVDLALEVFIGLAFLLLGREWVVAAWEMDAFSFAAWSALLLALGWSLGSRGRGMSEWAARRRRRARVRRMRRSIARLSEEQRSALYTAYRLGSVPTEAGGEHYRLYHGLAAMGYVRGGGGLTVTWALTDECREAVEGMGWG